MLPKDDVHVPPSDPAGDAGLPDRPQRRRKTVLVWAVVLLVLAGVVVPLGFAIARAREAARFAACKCPLGSLHVALANYHSVHGCYPPAYLCDDEGKPMHSWRVLILPYLERQEIYDQYDFSEPWNGPNNRRLAKAVAEFWQCPSSDLKGTEFTSYVAVVGPGTLWPGSESSWLTGNPGPGIDNIQVVEVANSDVHWMEPRDLTLQQALAGIEPDSGLGISSHHPKGINYLCPGALARTLSRDIDGQSLRELLVLDPSDPAIEKVKPRGMP